MEELSSRARIWIVGGVVAVVAMTALGFLLSDGSGGPGVTLTALRSGLADTATETRTSTTDDSGTDTVPSTPTPEPAVGNLADLVDGYGHPPGYDFAQIRIPILGVDAPVGTSVVDGAAGAVLGSPEGPATVFWYDLGEWAGLGGRPGEGGNAIFGGHVDISAYLPYADVTYHGPAVFRDLYLLAPGDRIFVDYNGTSLEYEVRWTEQVNAGGGARWNEIWSSDVTTEAITLYTCGGDFDLASASYVDRFVVRAERV